MSVTPLTPVPIPGEGAAAQPEPTRMEVSYATAWRRCWGFLLDLVFVLLSARLAGHGGAVGWVIYGAFIVVYFVGLVAEGGTPGMRLAGLRVTRVNGPAPGVGSATVRLIVFPCSVLAVGAGLLWMLDQARCQTWHDIAASTVVVRERRVRTIATWSENAPWASAKTPPG